MRIICIFLKILLRITSILALSGVYKLDDYRSVKLDCSSNPQTLYNKYGNYYYLSDLFQNSASVRFLQIGNCRGRVLDGSLRNRFVNMVTFNITSFEVENLSSADLNFKFLEKFLASYNKLTTVPGWLFRNSPLINEIDLSVNKISIIEREAFFGLKKLKMLNLQNNLIESIDNDTFKENEEIMTLNLQNNPIHRFDSNIFSLLVRLSAVHILYDNPTEIDITSIGSPLQFEFVFDDDNEDQFALQIKNETKRIHFTNEIFSKVRYFNISGDQLNNTVRVIDQLGPLVETLDTSSNYLGELSAQTFKKFDNLKYLNVENTQISSINSGFVQFLNNNEKLEILNLNHNSIEKGNCELFLFGANSSKLEIIIENIDLNCLTDSFQIDTENENTTESHVNVTERIVGSLFKNQSFIKFTGNKLQGFMDTIALLVPSIRSLDLSSSFVGQINTTTFERLNNLQYLNLSNSNLTNFGFKSFYHQKKLRVLDISYNRLKKINFTPFLSNFKELHTLNIEGNSLSELDTVTRVNFPTLSTLGISKNQFSCEYLGQFLANWQSLHLINNASNKINVNGIDCYHDEYDNTLNVTEPTDVVKTTNTEQNFALEELRTLKWLFVGFIVMFIVIFFVLSIYLRNIKKRRTSDSKENHVYYQKGGECLLE